jgi:hypothetical protein
MDMSWRKISLSCLALSLPLALLWGPGAFLSWGLAACGLVGLVVFDEARIWATRGLVVLVACVALAFLAPADEQLAYVIGCLGAVLAAGAVLSFDERVKWRKQALGGTAMVLVAVVMAAAVYVGQGLNPGGPPPAPPTLTGALLMALTAGGILVLVAVLVREIFTKPLPAELPMGRNRAEDKQPH